MRREELPPIPQLATRGQRGCFTIHPLDFFVGDKSKATESDGWVSWCRRSAGAHLAVELGLLLQTKVLGGVGHDGEGGFWIVPEREEENGGSAWRPL